MAGNRWSRLLSAHHSPPSRHPRTRSASKGEREGGHDSRLPVLSTRPSIFHVLRNWVAEEHSSQEAACKRKEGGRGALCNKGRREEGPLQGRDVGRRAVCPE